MRTRRPYYARKSRLDPDAGEIASWIEPAARTAYVAKGAVYAALCALGGLVLSGRDGGPPSLAPDASVVDAIPGDPGVALGLLWIAVAGLAVYVLWRGAQALLDPEGRGTGMWAVGVRAACLLSGAVYGWVAFTLARAALGAPPADVTGGAGVLGAAAGEGRSGWLAALFSGAVAVRGISELYLAVKPYLPQEIRLAGLRGAAADRVLALGRAALILRGGALAVLGSLLLVTTPADGPALLATARWLLELFVGHRAGWLLLVLVSCGSVYAIYQLVKARYRLIGEL